ncbi:xanthine dehydrogenase family protein molybdopterin-binding subunit [Plantactinospora endophytica]|uniref:Carbon-monoxide dehydrogenase large subunit n=1 Tax=Plantactinospora endophytica TaxID=673535 RepID=A0ABQ4DZ22_9ACTN|nr:xanthine dehydrogenase family protein molybdopterin-binding subunit [Plantactinospora endophytica]GIG87713.1 carbon-monoxide dehydrogenase large subunit [Plantactinospora endophytica]
MARSLLGNPVNRVDGPVKVTGQARYAADNNPPDLCHGYLLTSTIANGMVLSMDLGAAEQSGGVIAIYTPDNRLPLHGEPPFLPNVLGERRRPLSDHEVRYHGQIIGVVVADTFEQARDAAALIRVAYRELPPNSSFEENLDRGEQPPFVGLPLGVPVDIGVASIDDALAASQVTQATTYRHPPRHHNAMEPHSAVAVWKGDELTIYSGTQGPAAHAEELAVALAVDKTKVHVVSPHVGGGFGGKAFTWAPTLLAAAAARSLGRPVKIVTTREQLYTVTGHRSAVVQTMTLGAREDGTLNAIKHHSFTEALVEDPGVRTTLSFYATPNLQLRLLCPPGMNLPTPTILRAPGDETGSFALECAMDELAIRLQMDPIDLRLKNYLRTSLQTGLPYSSKHLDECYRVGAARFGWSRRRAAPRSVSDGDWLVGMGMASAVLAAGRAATTVRVLFRADGTAAVATATADLGTGMWTILAMMGAESLGIPVDRIRPSIGDSRLPVGPGSAPYGAIGSAATATVMPAVRDAADNAIAALIQHGVTHRRSPLRGLSVEQVRYRDGKLSGGGTTIGFGELLTTTRTREHGATTTNEVKESTEYVFGSYAAHFCEVRVNRFTGEALLSRMTTVVDAGTILNEKTARNQITGGVIFGIGPALFEGGHVEASTGRIDNANLADYLIPVNTDVPDIDVVFLDHPDPNVSPVGARGLGELGTIGSAAAVVNAVCNATGKRIRDLPITPDKLFE